MSSGSIFDSESDKGSGRKTLAIAVIAFVVICGLAYAVYWHSIPAGRTHNEILAEDVRETAVMMLAYSRFSGDEFRRQILGKGRVERYVKVTDDVYFTFPQTDDQEFTDFVAKYFYDPAKVDFGKQGNGVINLGGYELTISPDASHFFRTNLENVRIDPNQILNFPFTHLNYTLSMEELRNLANNSQTYGGKLIAQMPERKYQPVIIFANHGIMVAKPNEPSLKRLTDELLKDVGDNREARIQRLVDFVSYEIQYSYTEAVGSRETLKRADETLMTRSGDCSNKTILLASLLEQIGEEYILLYCPQHITVAVPQGNYQNENKLDFTWSEKPWLIAETTLPGFQVGKTRVKDSIRLTRIEYVQDPKNADVIFDADSYAVLKFL